MTPDNYEFYVSKLEYKDTLTFNRPSRKQFYNSVRKKDRIELRPFTFDPNIIDADGLLAMGLPERLIKTIVNYREKGGRFREAEDLQKIYGMKDDFFNRLKPFIEFDTVGIQLPGKTQVKNKPVKKIDLNLADTSQLADLPGFGPWSARKIVEYREKLGGFINAEQLNEVWGLRQENVEIASSHIFISGLPERISINNAAVEELASHPYIGFKQAKAIVKYRESHGSYERLEDMLKSYIIDEEFLNKAGPYLEL